MNAIYKLGIMGGLALMIGCTSKPKMELDSAPKEQVVNSKEELSNLMSRFSGNHIDKSVSEVIIPEKPDFEIKYDVDEDGIKDIAFEAGTIFYKDGYCFDGVYYVIHSSELSETAKIKYLNGRDSYEEMNDIKLWETHLDYPIKWHKHIEAFCGL